MCFYQLKEFALYAGGIILFIFAWRESVFKPFMYRVCMYVFSWVLNEQSNVVQAAVEVAM